MNPRLLILIVIAAGMAIYFASIKSGTKPADILENTSMTPEEKDHLKQVTKTLEKFPLPGAEPAEKPDLVTQVEVDRSKGKNRLYFTITEAHGYYVEQFQIHFWYVPKGGAKSDKPPAEATQFFDRFLPAKGTLRVCMEVVPAELADVGGDMGDSSNWKAEVVWHGRARTQSPNPLPPRTDLATSCD